MSEEAINQVGAGGGGDCEVLKKRPSYLSQTGESHENFKFFLGCAKKGRIFEISKGCVA